MKKTEAFKGADAFEELRALQARSEQSRMGDAPFEISAIATYRDAQGVLDVRVEYETSK